MVQWLQFRINISILIGCSAAECSVAIDFCPIINLKGATILTIYLKSFEKKMDFVGREGVKKTTMLKNKNYFASCFIFH